MNIHFEGLGPIVGGVQNIYSLGDLWNCYDIFNIYQDWLMDTP